MTTIKCNTILSIWLCPKRTLKYFEWFGNSLAHHGLQKRIFIKYKQVNLGKKPQDIMSCHGANNVNPSFKLKRLPFQMRPEGNK